MKKTKRELLEWIKMNDVLNNLYKKTASDILRECGQYDTVPINIKKLLSDLNIKVAKDDFKELEKLEGIRKLIESRGDICGLVLADEDVKIVYKQNKFDDMSSAQMNSAEKRAKFTLAHELAHCCLHAPHLDGGYVDFRCNQEPILHKEEHELNTYEKSEFDANVFAGELLIPKHTLEKILNLLKVPSLNALVNIFEVSSNVMKARLAYLGIEYVDDIF